ncbi:hypothetical protein DES49_0714 [Halospina denitrificans]|uniref:Uncharacterized protein n=1 Tax=Halospina denitrificans TaxID=332522 RepID=A0A4R7K1A7_9GAMM|nr:tetratricopeptide repeat protein [Halospina denitrificans]TDT44601.1 hypothetical protein DES49_0714 [Halospina denitrificans]
MREESGHQIVRLCRVRQAVALMVVLLLGGCSMVQDRPSDDQEVIAPIETKEPEDVETQEPDTPERDARQRQTGSELSPAAASLLASARGMLLAGNTERALNLAQRAQRISPDAAQVYYRLAEIYQKRSDHARAEQFALKGISKAGNDPKLRRTGWSLLADVRASRGDEEGAREARKRASRS